MMVSCKRGTFGRCVGGSLQAEDRASHPTAIGATYVLEAEAGGFRRHKTRMGQWGGFFLQCGTVG